MNVLVKPSYWLLTLVTLWLSMLSAFSQKSRPHTYQDYTLVTNLDSLEQAVQTLKNSPQAYLNGLITLEKKPNRLCRCIRREIEYY